ncbi:MAG: histidinol-phosphate transaminase [Candidatus Omnitrophica bacterium]|nr:histidinol-phosphate transaminase [Candidatus Omnitrophota bacterium]
MAKNPYSKKAIEGLSAYTPGEQPKPDPDLVKLNTNENPYPPSPRVVETLKDFEIDRLRRYSDPLSSLLRNRAAELLKVDSNSVLAGNGSDELLAMILRAFVDPGDEVVYPVPTYSLYVTLTRMYGGVPVEVPAEIGGSKVDKVLDREAAVTFIASPNSPDGYQTEQGEIRKLCEKRMGTGVVVVDEAYVDFTEGSCVPLVEKYENLVVTQTLSKSFSLAGLRLGIAVAGSALLQPLQVVKDSYNLGSLPQALGAAALSDPDHMRSNAKRIVETREITQDKLRERGWKVFPSKANFIFAEPAGFEAKQLYEELAKRKVYVRYFSSPPLDRGLRISVGSPEQMAKFFKAVDEIVG